MTGVVVERVLKGDAIPGGLVEVRQDGTITRMWDVEPLLIPDLHYLLFLHQFHFVPGDSTSEYATVGGPAGLYREQADGSEVLLDEGSPAALPRVLSLDDVTRVIGS